MSEPSSSRVRARSTNAGKPAVLRVEIRREIYTGRSTIGRLFVNGEFECYTLEDCARAPGTKVPGATCIPAGSYSLTINYSSRFKKMLPQLLAVPGFEGIRIHAGNTDADTEGCILVGQTQAENYVGKSRTAFGKLLTRLQAATRGGGEVRVRVMDGERAVPNLSIPGEPV